MKFELRAGTEIELTTPGEYREELRRHRLALARHSEINRPLPKTVRGSVLLDGAGAGVIDLGIPSTNRTWNVRRITVNYQDAQAALAAGIAAAYFGNDPTNPMSLVERLGNGTQLPATTKFSADQFVITQDEHLFVRVSGGALSVFAFASAQVIDGPRSTVYEVDLPEGNGKRSSLSTLV